MAYRQYTETDIQDSIQEMEAERACDYEDEGVPYDILIDEPWEHVKLPTGLLPVQFRYGQMFLTHIHFLEHGRRYQEVEEPDRVKLVGGAGPF